MTSSTAPSTRPAHGSRHHHRKVPLRTGGPEYPSACSGDRWAKPLEDMNMWGEEPFAPADVTGWMAPALAPFSTVVCGTQWRDDISAGRWPRWREAAAGSIWTDRG